MDRRDEEVNNDRQTEKDMKEQEWMNDQVNELNNYINNEWRNELIAERESKEARIMRMDEWINE